MDAQDLGEYDRVEMALAKCTLIFIALHLTACASIKNRYRNQNFLVFESGKCTVERVHKLDARGIPKKENLKSHHDAFNLMGLSGNEAIESYCGPDCESTITEKHKVGARRNNHELFLTNETGNETVRLDFKGNTYRRISFHSSDEILLETGSCEFTRLP